MRKRALYLFNIFPRKIVVVYFLGLVVILLTSSFVIVIGLSQVATFSYAMTGQGISGVSSFGNQVMLTEHDARTVYTSQVPVTISDALNRIDSLSGPLASYPLTLTPVNINSTIPIVVRGLPQSVISLQGLAFGQENSSNLLLIGSEAEQRLHAKLGDNVSISSPFASTPLNATVTGFFNTASEEDYEIVVSFSFGEKIAGLPNGIANALVIPRGTQFNPSILGYNYFFNVRYSGPSGQLLFIDSSGYVHYSATAAPANGSNVAKENLQLILPFGLYEAVLERNGLRTNLDQFATSENNSLLVINSRLSVSGAFLNVFTNGNSSVPTLLDSSNSSISPLYFDQRTSSWVFGIPYGTYSLTFGGSTHRILIFGNSTFNASIPVLNSILKVQVVSQAGVPSYSITVKDMQTSQIIFGSLSTVANLSIPVQSQHNYSVAILTNGNLLAEQNVSTTLETTSIVFNIPYIPQQLRSVPVLDYAKLGVGFPSQTASFDYFFGTITASTIALFSVIIVLLLFTLILFDSRFLSALRSEIHAITFMFPRRRAFILKISAPLLMLSLAAAGTAIVLSYYVFVLLRLNLIFSFVGYGAQFYPLIYVAPALLIIATFSWLRISTFFTKSIRGGLG